MEKQRAGDLLGRVFNILCMILENFEGILHYYDKETMFLELKHLISAPQAGNFCSFVHFHEFSLQNHVYF